MNTRVVLWSVVAVAAVAGIVFLVMTGRSRRPTVTTDAAAIKAYAARVESQLNRLAKELDKAMALGDTTGRLAKVEQELNAALAALKTLGRAPEPKQAYRDLQQLQKKVRTIRRDLHRATGDPGRRGRRWSMLPEPAAG